MPEPANASSARARDLHARAVVIDAVAPLLQEKKFLDWYAEGGVTAVCPTVGGYLHWARDTLLDLGRWHAHLREHADKFLLVRTAADILTARESGRLGLIFHFQGTKPVEDEIDLVDAYAALGLRIVQLAYNKKNLVGDGAEERTDAGLSHFGIKLIRRLNECRVAVDCAHTGVRTTLDAVEHSSRPVIVTHANARGNHESPRNLPDEVIRAIAGNGGVIGSVGFPAFLAGGTTPTLDDFIADIDYKVQLVGIDHVGLGIDYYLGMHHVADPEAARRRYESRLASGDWRTDSYPPPPHHYPAGIETPRTLPALTEGLLRKGYSEEDILKILGGNWLRVFETIWGG